MLKKSKVFYLLLVIFTIFGIKNNSFAKDLEKSKDIIDFQKINESNKKEDINLFTKTIENKKFNDEKLKESSLKQDPYEIYTDYSSIDKKEIKRNLPTIFMRNMVLPTTINHKYDLRDQGKVSSVKDQGPNGSCWAFATFGSAESILMPYERMDFSEKHMRNTHGFDWGPSEGGTRTVSSAYLARRSGPVLEKDDPYDIYGTNSLENLPISKELTHAIFIPDRRNSTDNDLLKKMIMENGGIYSAVMGGDEYINKKTMAHYYNGSQAPNHAITIIGWDDNYSRKNFKTQPQGDGAWICKNSWGTGWGNQGGYYYVSYYDRNIGTQNSQYILKDLNEHEKIWQYDKLGMTSQVGLGEQSYYANVFGPTNEDSYLKNVGLWSSANNSEYEIFVNTNVDNNSGLADKQSIGEGKMEFAGYEKVGVEETFIPKGSKFAVIVKMKTPGYKYPIPIERPIKGFSSKTTAESGQSFVSKEGIKWTDLTDQIKNANVSLKAFTITADYIDENDKQIPKIENINFKEKEKLMKIGEKSKLQVETKPSDVDSSKLRWESSDRTVCEVDRDGNIKAIGYGECVITVKSRSSSKVFDTMRIKVDESNAEFKANVNVDRQNYLQGDKVELNIALRDQDNNQIVNKDIGCEIVTSHNQKFNYDLKTNLTGEANFNVRLDNNAAIGKYKVNIYYKDKLIGINTFNVESKDFVPTIENPLFVTNILDKKAIKPSSELKLVSKVTNKYGDIKRYAKVNLLIISPSQKEIKKNLYTNKDGEAIFNLGKDIFTEEGIYKLKVDVSLNGFDDFTETLNVLVDRNTTEMEKLKLDMDIGKDIYLAEKDKVDINFNVTNDNKPIQDANVRVSITDPNQKSYDLDLKTDKDGKAVFSMDLSNNNATGVYKIDATAYKDGFYDVEKDGEFFVKKEGKFLNISFESAKKVYKLNESAYIKVQIKDENNKPKRNASVDISIIDPNQKENKVRKVTDYQGNVFIYMTPKAYTSYGQYQIKAYASAYGYPSTSGKYKIRFGEDDQKYKDLTISANNKKEKYFVDENAEIDINTLDEFGNYVKDCEVNISVKTPDNKVLIDRLKTDDKGYGKWTYKVGLKPGKYEVTLRSDKSNFKSITKTIIFNVVERPKLTKLNPIIKKDKKIYLKDQKAKIDLILKDENEKYVDDANVKASIIFNKSKRNLETKTDKNGHVSYDIDLEKSGKYEVDFEISKDGFEKTNKRCILFVINKNFEKSSKEYFGKIKATEVDSYIKENKPFILDTRSKSSFDMAHIKESFNLDYNDKDFKLFLDIFDKDSNIFLISNKSSTDKIMKDFKNKGFKSVCAIEEGMEEYIKITNLDNGDYNRNLQLSLIRDKEVYDVKKELTFNAKSSDINNNYIANANVDYKLLDLAGTVLDKGEFKTNNLGQAELKIKLANNTYPGKYKLIAQVQKEGYKSSSAFVSFKLSSKDKADDFKDYESIKNDSYFDHLKDDKENEKILKNIYGKNILGYKVKNFSGKDHMIEDDFDLDKVSLILFSDKDQSNLENFAKLSHKSYNFKRISSTNDSEYLKEKNIKRLISYSGEDVNKVKEQLKLGKDAKILVLNEDGRIINLFGKRDFENIKEILSKQNIKIVDDIVDPNKGQILQKRADIKITCPNKIVRVENIFELNVEIKDRDSGKALSNRNIKYTLVDPFGRSLAYNRQTDKNGRHIFKVGTNYKTSLGKYKVKVELLDAEYKNTFKFLEYEVVDKNTPEKLQMKADISTDKNKYDLGDKINLNIKVKDLNDSLLDKAEASVILEDSNEKQIYNKSTISDKNGEIKLSFDTSDENILGSYKLKIKINREGFKEYYKEINIQVGKDNPKVDPEKPEDEKLNPGTPENPVDVKLKEQTFPLSFEGASALGFFDITDSLTMINVKAKYGYNYKNLVFYNKDSKPVKVSEIIDDKRPTIMLMGDRIDSKSMNMFENSSKIDNKAFNFVNVVTNGSSKDLESISKGKLYEKYFYRGNSINGQFRSNKNQVVVLDKNGAMINVFPYKSNYELLRRFNMLNGYYADKDNYKLLSLDKFENSYPISYKQRKERGDYNKVSQDEKKYNDKYGNDFSNVKLIKSDNSRLGLDQISNKDLKILLLGDYRKPETIKMWENSNYIKDGNYNIINVSYLGSQFDINSNKERFKSLWDVKKDIYVTGGYNTLFNQTKPTIVALDKNQRFLFSKEYNTNDDIKYVIDRTINTFASSETITDSYKNIENLDILEDIPEKIDDPNKVYPMTFDQRKERGDYTLFEPNEKDVNKKYYGKDMKFYMVKDTENNSVYIKDLLDKRINVILLGSPNDKKSRIMWKNSAYLDKEKINFIKMTNYKGLEDLNYMFKFYDMNDVKDNFYYGGEKFDFDKEVSSPFVVVTDEDGKLLYLKKYNSNEDIEDLVNRAWKTKFSNDLVESEFPPIADEKISFDNRDHEPQYIEPIEDRELEGNFPITYNQRQYRGDYDGLTNDEIDLNKKFYGRDIKNINLLKNDNSYERISSIKDENLTLLLLGNYKESSAFNMWTDCKDIISEDFSIKLLNTIGSTQLLNNALDENGIDIKEIYTNANSLAYLSNRKNNVIIAIDQDSKVIFIKNYNNINDLKFVLDRTLATRYSYDIRSNNIPEINDIEFN